MAFKLTFGLLIMLLVSCKKENNPSPRAKQRDIVYEVSGTHFKLNYIDSNSVFKRDEVYNDSFRYAFKKSSGASIGISIFKQTSDDQIYSWKIYVDGQLYANAYSEGGAYFTVPYY
jgi:hypothetical protein